MLVNTRDARSSWRVGESEEEREAIIENQSKEREISENDQRRVRIVCSVPRM